MGTKRVREGGLVFGVRNIGTLNKERKRELDGIEGDAQSLKRNGLGFFEALG